jgi:hypothetical protein
VSFLDLDESVLRIVADANRIQDSTCEARGVRQLELGTLNDFECEARESDIIIFSLLKRFVGLVLERSAQGGG